MKADLKPPSTTERVLLIRKNAPYATQSDIAKLLGVTRERIRQILKKHGLPPVVKRPPKYHQCLYCGANILTKFYRRQYCDEHCRTLHLWGIYPCDVCGKDIAMDEDLKSPTTGEGDYHEECLKALGFTDKQIEEGQEL